MELTYFPAPFDRLCRREREVLGHLLSGARNKQLANDLNISPKTAHSYRTSIMKRTGVDNIVALVLLAVRSGVIQVPPAEDNAVEELTADPWPEDAIRPAA